MIGTLATLSKQLRSGETTSVQLTEHYLKVIEEKNGELNAFVHFDEDAKNNALEMAKRADEMLKAGEGTELTGIPLGIKDNFCEKDMLSEACSNILKGFKPPYEGTVLQKLREMGAVFLGHTNTDEFTMGASTETSCYGTTKNPVPGKQLHTAGGSSGGSAAAVGAGMCAWALGTDTGGSIRQPAAYCGITGLKVTYGRVSRYGVMSMASSLDTIGCLAQNPEDAAIILKYIAGHDEMDGTTPEVEVPDYPTLLKKPLEGVKVGVPKEYTTAGNWGPVNEMFKKSLEQAKKLGAIINNEISLPMTKHAVAVYYIICPSEVSANMSRYDGLRFGPKSDQEDLVSSYFEARTKGFGDEVKRRIMIGTYCLSAGYFDAYYKKALKVRTLIIEDFKNAFEDVDVLMSPTMPHVAFESGSIKDPLGMYLEDVLTAPISIAGVPAISIPNGEIDGLPTGLQIIGPHFGEEKILNVAHHLSP